MSKEKDTKTLIVEYDTFNEEGSKVLNVIDMDGIVMSTFHGDKAEKIFELLCGDISEDDVRFAEET